MKRTSKGARLRELKYDLAMARAALDLCPKQAGSITGISFSIPGSKSVTFTAKTRINIQRRIDTIKAELRRLGVRP